MKYDVYLTETFQKSVKLLKRKYPRVKSDLLECIGALEKDPSIGDAIPGWKSEIWKVRVASSDMKKGKRGGYRLVYFWKTDATEVYCLTVYFKGEKSESAKKEIETLLDGLHKEL